MNKRRRGFGLWALLLSGIGVLSAASGQGLAADPGSPGAGVVQVPWDRFELLLSPNGRNTRVEGSKGLCTVAAGRYKLVYITLKASDENGDEWQMRSDYRSRRALVVRPGRTTKISVCPPFTARLRVSRHRVVGGQTVRFRLEIVDEEGWFYGAPRPMHAGASGPRITLVDSKGNQIDACTLGHDRRGGAWRVPEDLFGLLSVKTTLRESPFDISVLRGCRILVGQPGKKPEGGYRLLGEPIVQVAAQPTGMNAVELLWEVNDTPPYDAKRFRALTAVFTPDGQAEFLKDKYFDILAGLDGATFVRIATVKGPTNRYLHRGVRAGWLYYYKVRAYDEAGELMAESAVTLGADGPNLVEDPGFEQRPPGPVPDKDNQPVHEDKCYPAKGFTVVKGARPYSQGAKILKFDPAWTGRRQVSFYGNLIALSADKTYLQGGWVRAPGNAWLGRFFYDGDKKTISWAYAIMSARNTPEWTFGVQLLVPDRDKTGFKRNEDGRVFGMAQKHWNFPPEAKYISAFVTAFGAGECDDHWIVEVSKAPPGTSVAPAAK